VPEISATDAARNFADVLDAVEHRHEHYTVVRRGRVVAHISPMLGGRGADVKALLAGARRDLSWTAELTELRALLTIEDRS
jgi:prevent-host-death family protein